MNARTQSGSKTADDILDRAEELIQTRGYSAFSYQDIADALGIRKASIHYHFPAKADLGLSVLDRYCSRLEAGLVAIAADPSRSAMDALDIYVAVFRQLAETPDKICLCAALAGELMALPEPMRARMAAFFEQQQSWLAGILERGAGRGEIKLSLPPRPVARLAFGALQGALLVKRTTGDASQIADVIAALRLQLGAPGRE